MKDSSANYTSVAGDGTLPVVQGVAVAPTPALVELIAPATMPAGYQFSVDVNGRHVLVAVPEGGVKEGQQFQAIVVNNDVEGSAQSNGHSIPEGRWRDGIFDCLDLGLCHAQCWLTFCCKPLALGQILSRMKLDWSGSPLNGRTALMSAFQVMLLTFIVYNTVDMTIYYITYPYVAAAEYDEATGMYTLPENVPSWALHLDTVRESLTLLYSIFILIIMMRTRAHIRQKYQIPEQSCQGCEDCCCSFWCSACTVCQMARHTADYKTYKASCCSETGLESMAPEVV